MDPYAIVERAKRQAERAGHRATISALEDLRWAPGYAEPGYAEPEHGVILGNWNDAQRRADPKTEPGQHWIDESDVMSRLSGLLERAGAAIEWSDEWCECDDCQKTFRTSPDGYGWTPSGIIDESGCLCADCLAADPVDWLESLEDNPRQAVFLSGIDPTDHGYIPVAPDSDEYETGFHPGQNDDPTDVLRALHKQGRTRILFQITDTGQFDTRWIALEYRGED